MLRAASLGRSSGAQSVHSATVKSQQALRSNGSVGVPLQRASRSKPGSAQRPSSTPSSCNLLPAIQQSSTQALATLSRPQNQGSGYLTSCCSCTGWSCSAGSWSSLLGLRASAFLPWWSCRWACYLLILLAFWPERSRVLTPVLLGLGVAHVLLSVALFFHAKRNRDQG